MLQPMGLPEWDTTEKLNNKRTSSKQVVGFLFVYPAVARKVTHSCTESSRKSSVVLGDTGSLAGPRDVHFEEMVFMIAGFSVIYGQAPYSNHDLLVCPVSVDFPHSSLKQITSGSCMWSVSAQSSDSLPFLRVLHPVWIILILNSPFILGRTGIEQMCSSHDPKSVWEPVMTLTIYS